MHNIKDLEKSLPAVASINAVTVKEYLQALTDDGKLRVEKIGSGNWYWSFMSEEKKNRENTINKLCEEKMRVDAAVEELEAKVKEASAARNEDGEEGREELVEMHSQLQSEVRALRAELATYSENDPMEVVRRKEDVEACKIRAGRWTDNIYMLEAYMKEITGGDREQIEGIRAMFYGSEYVEGEGLREL